MKQWRVGILGATGTVGQRFIQLLEAHPWFTITALAASDRSEGKRYGDAVAWKLPTPLPARVAELTLGACRPPLDCDVIFSSLPGEMAGETEAAFAAAGYPVISNSSAHRMAADVPLLVPEINAEHARLIPVQQQRRDWTRGFLVTNPNCTTLALVLPLAALEQAFGVELAVVSTMQAISGAGYPGVASLDIVDNVIPYIAGEETKVETEPRKILGRLSGDQVEPAPLRLSAHCHRVAVTDGHLCAVSVKLRQSAPVEDVCAALVEFRGVPEARSLPSSPSRPIVLRSEPDRPQPRLDRDLERGMASIVGRVREDPLFDVKMTILGHNTVRGAAGATLLNAEFLAATGRLT
ncbi:MAG: aspartate-semialdehyde dehydrogenase [Chloracidobacterium sp.]|uniref:Aspartate-semialdehyde dehydrogenase n=1 Tax=Chloracidobacterium validum TaxID=2821543 RepID=A0ABX8B7L3_9BACT|nr:aspartate-semialdehyde dehydrogenase [Chloracidobacterium validum]QUW02046.1 aspartate-semialdehyde dehydrogenase [Chloracidobacterium validum]